MPESWVVGGFVVGGSGMRNTGMRQVAGACVAAALVLGAPKAGAVVLLSDNFDAEPVPASPGWVANYNSFANFFVGSGTVDLLGPSNPFGLTGSGNFVDLDGST